MTDKPTINDPITSEEVAALKDLYASVEAGPWFLDDCEGDLKIWRESVVRISRDEAGEVVGYSSPASYRSIDLIAEWDLETWDDGESLDDDERRRVADLMVESFNALPRLLERLRLAEELLRRLGATPVQSDHGTPYVRASDLHGAWRPWRRATAAPDTPPAQPELPLGGEA